MKKKTARTTRTVHAKTPRRASTPKRTILFRRIVIISSCIVLVIGTGILINKQKVEQSVAGASIMRGLFVQATLTMPTHPNAVAYNIYYRQVGETEFTNAVRNVPTTVPAYIISHLKKGTSYEYKFAAVDAGGSEFLFSEVVPLTNLQPM